MVKIRLMRMGRKKIPFYRIVAVDSRKKRDGAYIEKLGYYNPLTSPATIQIDGERVRYWMDRGAKPTDTVHNLLKKTGWLHRWNLETQEIPEEIKEIELKKWEEQQEKRLEKEKQSHEKKKSLATTSAAVAEEETPDEPAEETVVEEPKEVAAESAETSKEQVKEEKKESTEE